MFETITFNAIFFVILLIHYKLVEYIEPTEDTGSSSEFGTVISWRDTKTGPVLQDIFSKVKNGTILIYNSENQKTSTSSTGINIYDSTGNMVDVSHITLNNIEKLKYPTDSKLIINRDVGNEKVYAELLIDKTEIQAYQTAIMESTFEYGNQTDGSVVLNNAQQDIKKYIEESKKYKKIIESSDTTMSTNETAVANLMALRDNLDKKLKSYENPNTINGILKGEITEYKDIISCDCSLGNLRDITVQLNYIILGYIITFFIVNKIFDFFLDKNKHLLMKIINSLQIFLYGAFIICAILYHGYLLTYCRCSIPRDNQKMYSYLFMLFFLVLLIVEIVLKAS